MRAIYHIAVDIEKDWKEQSTKKPKAYEVHARPYLDAMHSLNRITDTYFYDDARSIVMYFLSNAQTWRGDVARAIKVELKQLLKR